MNEGQHGHGRDEKEQAVDQPRCETEPPRMSAKGREQKEVKEGEEPPPQNVDRKPDYDGSAALYGEERSSEKR
jgi:hypothetical protein